MPRRACGFGGNGSGRRSRAASAAGSAASSTSWLTDSCAGSATVGPGAGGGALGQQDVDVGGPALRVVELRVLRGLGRKQVHLAAGLRGGLGTRRAALGRARAAPPGRAPRRRARAADRAPSGSAGHSAVGWSSGGRVFVVVRGFVGPLLGAVHGGDLDEELRGLPRPVASGAPPVPGGEQHALGPGERDVEQPPLLGEPPLVERVGVRLDRVLELLAVAADGQVQRGQVVRRRRAAPPAARPGWSARSRRSCGRGRPAPPGAGPPRPPTPGPSRRAR